MLVLTRQTSKLRSDRQFPGWYLDGGVAARQGSTLEIRFPLFEDGGPFSVKAGLQLLDPGRPFRMAFGQMVVSSFGVGGSTGGVYIVG